MLMLDLFNAVFLVSKFIYFIIREKSAVQRCVVLVSKLMSFIIREKVLMLLDLFNVVLFWFLN